MRFQRLQIPAFGPFTKLELTFPSAGHDLHVIYGKNEAGKSSLLRAVRDLLFGIPGQSPDNFLHDYKEMRLLGEIESKAGERLIFQRRKGNKNTLLDEAGESLPDSALHPFLGSVDQAYFGTMFGLGGCELRDGALQLLRGEGEIGNALFSASMGGTPIQRVLEALEVESERLFKGRSTANVSIRPAATQHKELLNQSRDSMVNADEWERLEKGVEEQEKARKSLKDEIDAIEREIPWISRCEDALPSIGRLNEQLKFIGGLPALPDVASDFVERARAARSTANETSGKVRELGARITNLKKELAGYTTSPKVLADAEALDQLHQELGAYRDRKKTVATSRSTLAAIELRLRSGMNDLEVRGELESLETLRLGSAVRKKCEEAAKALKAAQAKLEKNREEAEALKKEITSQEKEVSSLPEKDLTPLREALTVAAGATEADRTLAASEAIVGNLARKVAAEHALVLGASTDPDATSSLAIPLPATIRKFRERFESPRREIEGATKRIREEEKNVKSMEADLKRLERRGELPSEESLKQAREYRDSGWQLVLADWKGSGAKGELDPDLPLEQAFPQAIIKADIIADKLRKDAEDVAEAEATRLQIQKSQDQIAEEKKRVAALEDSIAECQGAWKAEWAASGIPPRDPDEMEQWRETWMRFKETNDKLEEAKAAVKSKKEQLRQATETLAAVLEGSIKKPFAVLYESARNQIQQGELLTGRRDTIAGQLENRRKDLENFNQKTAGLQEAAATADATWNAQCKIAGLPVNTSPDSGLELVQERTALFEKFESWKVLSGEVKKMQEDIQWYAQSVSEKAVLLGIEGGITEAQEAALWKALSQARKAQAEHDQLAAQMESEKKDLSAAELAKTEASRVMDELIHLARLTEADELEPLIANLENRKLARDRIDSLRVTLGGLARGKAVEEFIASVQKEDPEELQQRKAQLESSKSGKKSALQEIEAKLTEQKRQKDELEKAGDAAADFRQKAESIAATLKMDAARHMRLRLAAHFLRTQIERFREENQGPLLEKSGQVFKQMTRGAFEGLAAEFNDKDIPVMVGRRVGGANVPLEGLSDGSRDQLYLALRLAALDRHLENHEPMPLILDDLLITFDDERAKAILPLLANLATRTQIFLFTHHAHLVGLCGETLGKGEFKLHRLGG